MTPPKEGTAVPSGFSLPWNVAKTIGEAWAEEAAEQRRKDRAIVRSSTYRPTHLTSKGKVKFAGHDKSEVQFRSKR